MLRLSITQFRCSSLRYSSSFADPFGVKDPLYGNLDTEDLHRHNAEVGYHKIIGDPKKGLADDTSVHPFGDLRINFVRMNSSNLCFWWEYDFTGGVIRNNGQNALLSDGVKKRIYSVHQSDPEQYSVERLADMYKVRQQRIMAILALKVCLHLPFATKIDCFMKEIADNELEGQGSSTEKYKGVLPPPMESPPEENKEEAKDEEKKKMTEEEWCQLCDWVEQESFNATAQQGSGERHFVSVSTYPKFQEIPLSEAEDYIKTEWEISRVNRMYKNKEDRFQIREFQERLLLNTGKIGQSLDFKTDRQKMRRSPPKTPTPLVVTSLDEDMKRPYVAEEDGTKRELTPDEFLIWKRTNRQSFTKLISQKIRNQL